MQQQRKHGKNEQTQHEKSADLGSRRGLLALLGLHLAMLVYVPPQGFYTLLHVHCSTLQHHDNVMCLQLHIKNVCVYMAAPQQPKHLQTLAAMSSAAVHEKDTEELG